MYKKIIVPIDGSESSLKALRHALALARTQSSIITVLSVIEELKLPFGVQYMLWANESHKELKRSTLESLNREINKIMEQESGLDVDAEIREGVPANVIVQMALDEGYDLIVIGKRGMGVLEELVMGNVARKVVDLSKVPVTVIP